MREEPHRAGRHHTRLVWRGPRLQRQGDSCYEVAKNLAKLCISVLSKVEPESNDLGYLAEETFRQNIEGAPWVLLTAYSKMQEVRDKFKEELLNKKEPELRNLENSQPIYIAKGEKACSEESTKGVAEQPFDKEIMGATHRLNQLSQQRPGREMGLRAAKTLPI